jgi:hypothetical protein
MPVGSPSLPVNASSESIDLQPGAALAVERKNAMAHFGIIANDRSMAEDFANRRFQKGFQPERAFESQRPKRSAAVAVRWGGASPLIKSLAGFSTK